MTDRSHWSIGRRWKFRRNVAIYSLASKCGWSQRMLADVFDLPRSRIATIVKEVAALGEPDQQSARAEKGPGDATRNTMHGNRRVNRAHRD
jgi:hypothetical protein